MDHQVEHQPPLLERGEDVGVGTPPGSKPMVRTPRKRGDVIWSSSRAIASATGLLGADAPDDRGGVAGGLAHRLALAGLLGDEAARGGHVHDLVDRPRRGLGDVVLGKEAPAHPRDVADVERLPPERYGYQSVRAGSQKWMWASTMRSIGVAMAPPRPRCGAAYSPPTTRRTAPSSQSGISGPP